MTPNHQRLSDAFRALEAVAGEGSPTLGAIVQEMGRRGHAMVILFLTLPFSLPLPVWGLSTPFGLVIALTALHMMLTRRLWLPRRLAARSVPSPPRPSACWRARSAMSVRAGGSCTPTRPWCASTPC
jgi:hypothetical protein